jgi:fatty acid-binding protein DegV
MPYVIMTDTNSDITYPFVDRYDIKIVYMPYYIDDQELFSDLARQREHRNSTSPCEAA